MNTVDNNKNLFRESILDADQDIPNKINTNIKLLIGSWLLNKANSVYISTYTDFRRITANDFKIDDNMCVDLSPCTDVEGITMFDIKSIPSYICFSYVGKRIVINGCKFTDKDASFLLHNLNSKGKRALHEIRIEKTNATSLGDLSKLHVQILNVTNNPNLNISSTELPTIGVYLSYVHNKNSFNLNNIRNKIDKHTIYRLDHITNGIEPYIDESIMDDDNEIIKIKPTKENLVSCFIKELIDNTNSIFNYNKLYADNKFNYVWVGLNDRFKKEISEPLLSDSSDIGPARELTNKFFNKLAERIITKKRTDYTNLLRDYTNLLQIERISNNTHISNNRHDIWYSTFKVMYNSIYIYFSVGFYISRLDNTITIQLDSDDGDLNRVVYNSIKEYR